jgi:hypothetical protein
MKFVIDDYPRYTVDSAREHGVAQSKLYDSYDLVNNRTARTALLSSLDATLYKTVHSALLPDDTFPVAWMLLIEELQSTSIQRFADIKLKIAAYKPSQVSGQSIKVFCTQVKELCNELDKAGQYELATTLHIVESLLEADGGLLYTLPLINTQRKVRAAIVKMGFEDDKQAIKTYLIQEKLTYSKVLEEASREYKNLVNSKAWKPALLAPDVKIPPSGFGANLAAGCQPVGAGTLPVEAFALIQTLNRLVPNGGGSGGAAGRGDGSSKPGLCHNCTLLGLLPMFPNESQFDARDFFTSQTISKARRQRNTRECNFETTFVVVQTAESPLFFQQILNTQKLFHGERAIQSPRVTHVLVTPVHEPFEPITVCLTVQPCAFAGGCQRAGSIRGSVDNI